MANQLTGRLRQIFGLPQFQREHRLIKSGEIIAWWERRRLFYNFLLFGAAVISGLLCLISALVSEPILGVPIGMPESPFLALAMGVVFAFVANICYTGGWVIEVFLLKVSPGDIERFGTASFKLGVMLSVSLALMPGVMSILVTTWCLIGRLVPWLPVPPLSEQP